MIFGGESVAAIKNHLAAAQGEALGSLMLALADDERPGVREAVNAVRRRQKAREAEHKRLCALYELESRLAREGFTLVAGVDEVGRGALAGPLSAGACILPASPHIEGINDSKRLSPARREELAVVIKQVAICWSVGHATPGEIDSLGVTSALRRAMGRAVAGLDLEPDHVVVDGLAVGIAASETAVVKGDSKVAAVAAASILAKVTRDAMMVALARDHPAYGFDVNKGYGTPEHLDAIRRTGLSVAHRRLFCRGSDTPTLF